MTHRAACDVETIDCGGEDIDPPDAAVERLPHRAFSQEVSAVDHRSNFWVPCELQGPKFAAQLHHVSGLGSRQQAVTRASRLSLSRASPRTCCRRAETRRSPRWS